MYAPHLHTLVSETPELCLVSQMLILQVSLSLLCLGPQRFHLQHQDPPLSAQHQQLRVWAINLGSNH